MQQGKSREEFLDEIEEKAGDYEVLWDHCAQGTLSALQEMHKVGDENTLRAATAMPGMALRGETCGAVIGAIMALGLIFGRTDPKDGAAVQTTMGAARKFCRRFEQEFGSCNCRDIQQKIFGRTFNFTIPEESEAWSAADGGNKCRMPAGKAARIASEIILDLKK